MRWIRDVLGLCGLVLAVAAGCASDRDVVKPPKQPEEFRAPPDSEGRYSRPLEYPKETMDQDPLKKASDKKGPGASRPGMGNGIGGKNF